MTDDSRDPIAIVGMGCRFPGANDPASFWNLLRDGVDAITEVPPDRFNIDDYYDPELGKPGKMNTRWGGFISDVDRFDADFFGITPREVQSMDPQHRILLEVAYEALEDGGIPLERIAGSNAGVFIGIAHTDYADLHLTEGLDPTPYYGTGRAHSIAANRISYTFDLHGPSLATDTACSSSLTALHLACQSLNRGECNLALVGGINLILTPTSTLGFSQAHMVSSDGRCKTFDVSADGYVRSEGCGIVVLKRLSAALRDGDLCAAVIRGTAMNEDGRTNGIMAPNVSAQEGVIRHALHDAGLQPADIDYVEAHGTGTPLGDQIEIDALKAALTEDRPLEPPLFVGSGKTNIGHAEAAAGMAGLIRTVLILQHRQVPPHLHLSTMHPAIKLEGVPLRIAGKLTSLEGHGKPLRAGVNSFGFGGTNCHAILEEAPANEVEATHGRTRLELLTLSARSPQALATTAEAYRKSLAQGTETATLHDVCYTAALHRTHHAERLALVADSHDGIRDQLQAFEQGENLRAISRGSAAIRHGKTAFVFAGMGAQWVGMGRQLLDGEPVFRDTIERCDAVMSRHVDWSVRDEILAVEAHSRLDDIGILQPVLFAIAIAVADLWRSWGVEPDAVVGHSVGEIAAVYVAGAVSLDEAARIVCARAAALRPASGHGAMLSVGLTESDTARILEGYNDRVAVAVVNGPTNTVLSGDRASLHEIAARLDDEGVFCRPVKSDIAFHSPQMDPLIERFSQSVGELHPHEAAIPIYSTVTTGRRDGREFDEAYWMRNFREPVAFGQTIEQMLADGYDTFLELSPHPVLVHAIKETAESTGKQILALPSLRRNEDERQTMLESLGELYVRGCPIQWAGLFKDGGRRVTVPSYTWQRERFWFERSAPDRTRRNGKARNEGHPLLGHPVVSAAHVGKRVWEIDLDFDAFPYLADHTVAGSTVFPAAGFAEMCLAVAHAIGPAPHVVENLNITQGLVLAADRAKTLQVVVTAEVPGVATLQFSSQDASGSVGQETWTQHATATVCSEPLERHLVPDSDVCPEEFETQADTIISAQDHHRYMTARTLAFGPAFAGVEGLYLKGAEALARIHLPAAAGTPDRYHMHPTLLDAGLQVLSSMMPLEPYLPASIGSLRLYDVPAHGLWAHATRRTENKYDQVVVGDIRMFNSDGQVVADMQGLHLQRRKVAADETADEWLYDLRWEVATYPAPHSSKTLQDDWQGSWLILTDGQELGHRLASLLEGHGLNCTFVSAGESYAQRGPRQYQLNPSRPEDFRRLLNEVFTAGPPLKGIVHLWNQGVAVGSENFPLRLQAAQDRGSIGVMHLVQALSARDGTAPPRLWLVTRGAQPIDGIDECGLVQSPLLGFGRVLANEHPELRCARVDVDPGRGSNSAELLLAEMLTEDREDEVAYRGGTRYVQRLARHVPPVLAPSEPGSGMVVTDETPFRLDTSGPGVLDNLRLGLVARETPGPGEIEIKVEATGLNFRDVMSAMGILPGYPDGLGPLGYECAGIVAAVGPDVSEFQVGEEVVALANYAFGSYVVVDVRLAVAKPRRFSFEEVATVPVTFLTAHYALLYLARIQKGESVLIHAAAGGVGLAAVQLAQAAGATIFATAGSPEKREYLRSLGVKHVMDSRSLDFADEVMRLTDGRGVDVVLNSLAGEFITRSLSVLAPYGRFLEIGRKDIYQNSQIGLYPFQRNLSFFAIDLDRLHHERPEFLGKLLREIMTQVEGGSLRPLPCTVFPVTRAADAFRFMAQAHHIGKIVISMDVAEVRVDEMEGSRFHPDATYLITGGFGGLGLKVAQWMVDRGARSLVLVGRRGATAEAEPVLGSLRRAGCTILSAAADMAREEDVDRLLVEVSASLPPLRGVIHAAGVLDDTTLLRLDRDRFQSVTAPKMSGAWNLHQLTRDTPLDFFVLFSSLATALGNVGQTNYAAANQFLDALAHYRRTQGLPGLSIAWGPWSEVGMGSSADLLDHFAAQGVIAIPPHHGLAILGRLLSEKATHVLVAAIDWQRRLESQPAWNGAPFLSAMTTGFAAAPRAERPSSEPLHTVLDAPDGERQAALETYLCDQAGRVMGISARKIGVGQSLALLGLDSLMAIELRNRIRIDLGADVAADAFLQGVAIEQIATMVLMQVLSKETAYTEGHVATEELEEITL